MKLKLLLLLIITTLLCLFNAPSIQAQSYFTKDNWETQLGSFSTINGQWHTSYPTNNTLGANSYQGINFGYDINNYSSLVNPIGTNDLYFGRWSFDWQGWRKLVIADGNGNVGIGTATPSALLDLQKLYGNDVGIKLSQPGSSIWDIKNTAATGLFTIGAGGGTYFNIDKASGNVGIGTTILTAKLQVEGLIKSYVPDVLGGNLNDFQLLDERGGNVTNKIYNRLWTLSDGGPNNWYGARLHDGISVDTSFNTPHIDTRTWWERDPQDNIQSWGNASDTYLTINNGNVGIGTTTPDKKLTVKGTIHSLEVIVDTAISPDYVFQKYYTGKSELKADYTMPTLAEIENFTKKNHHLPSVPSAQEIKQNGLSLGEMSNVLLQKVEELTLYAIEQQKKLEVQNKTIEMQSKILETLTKRLNGLEKK